jgi:membrane protease YdiL (CAAX protease family)
MTPVTALILFACWWLPVLLLALGLKVAGQTELHWRWFAAAALAYALYSLAGYWTLPEGAGSMPAEVRWYSRLVQLATGSAMIALVWNRHPLLGREGLALTARQNPGSLGWSIFGVVLLAAAGMLPGGIDPAHASAPAGPLGWLYHLTLPGLEEELIYRALLLSLLAIALGGTNKAIGWAAVMATMVFALAHGIFPDSGKIGFNLFMIGYTGFAGIILALMRLRSGSLLFPMLGHNLIGLTGRRA